MKLLKNTLLIASIFWFTSCVEDSGKLIVTYTKGTPTYGNINAVRNTAINGSAKEVINPGKIFVADDFLLIGEEGEGIHIVDNSDPAQPTNVGFINIPGNREFYYANQIIYAESYYDMLKIDVSDFQNPKLIHRAQEAFTEELQNANGQTLIGFEFEEVTEELHADDDLYGMMSDDGNNYIFYDYANSIIPPSAVPASFAGNSSGKIGSVNRIVEHKGYVYAVSRSNLLIFDQSFEVNKERWIASDMETVFPLNNHLFIGGRTQVTILDISNPLRPEHLSSFWHASSCDPIFPASDSIAYVTLRTGDFAECPGDQNALIVLNIEDLDYGYPVSLQEIEMLSPFGVQQINTKVYVGEGDNGLKIFDASNPENLVLDKWIKDISAYDVLEHPSEANIILVATPDGLNQYKISDDYTLISTIKYALQ